MKKWMLMMTPLLLVACNSHSHGPQTSSASFKGADIDHTGTLDYAEYNTLIGAQAANGNKDAQRIQSLSPASREVELKSEFRALDKDGNGQLSRAELGAY